MKKSKISEYLAEEGLLSQKIKGFQARQQQIDLTHNVIDALTQKKVALLEAGTGVGKTYSYLLPALYYAHTEKKKIAISTYTIQLQEQLLKKDIPNLLNILGFDLEINLVLGMNNYLCLKRLSEQKSLSEEIAFYSETSSDGRKPGFIPKETWEEIRVDSDLCLGPRCSHFKECFFFKERDKAKNSQILIFNHHLLASELFSKREKHYDWIIIDEAHHFEEVVRSVQGKKVNYLDLIKLFNKLYLEGKSEGGRLNMLSTMLDLTLKEHAFKQKFLFDLPALKREGLKAGKDFFDTLNFLMHSQDKLIIDTRLKSHPLWQEVAKSGREFLDHLKRFITFIAVTDLEIRNSKEEKLIDKSFNVRHEMNAYAERLSRYYETLNHVLFNPEDVNEVSWISTRNEASEVTLSKLEVAESLKEVLFKEERGIVFLSATLSAGSNFTFLKERLGIGEQTVEGIYPSPFNWEKQALFLVPQDLPDPDSSEFLGKAKEVILDCVKATYGHALILFTSYSSLSSFYEQLKKPLKDLKYTPLKQGDMGKHEIIEMFKSSKSPVLFGTDSFWEGIDIVGDVLRLVIIVKLPFKVPDEPIVQAISKKMKAEKKDPFFNYFLPQAVVKFKQGFGRLIRHHEDKGVVVCLDHRAVTKNYGKRFLSQLPDCPKEAILAKDVKGRIIAFFKRKS